MNMINKRISTYIFSNLFYLTMILIILLAAIAATFGISYFFGLILVLYIILIYPYFIDLIMDTHIKFKIRKVSFNKEQCASLLLKEISKYEELIGTNNTHRDINSYSNSRRDIVQSYSQRITMGYQSRLAQYKTLYELLNKETKRHQK